MISNSFVCSLNNGIKIYIWYVKIKIHAVAADKINAEFDPPFKLNGQSEVLRVLVMPISRVVVPHLLHILLKPGTICSTNNG